MPRATQRRVPAAAAAAAAAAPTANGAADRPATGTRAKAQAARHSVPAKRPRVATDDGDVVPKPKRAAALKAAAQKPTPVDDDLAGLPCATWADDFEGDFKRMYLRPSTLAPLMRQRRPPFLTRALLYCPSDPAPPFVRAPPRLRVVLRGWTTPHCPFARLLAFLQRGDDLACVWSSALVDRAASVSVLTDLRASVLARALPAGYRHLLVILAHSRKPDAAPVPVTAHAHARLLQAAAAVAAAAAGAAGETNNNGSGGPQVDEDAAWARVQKTSFARLAQSAHAFMVDLSAHALSLPRQILLDDGTTVRVALDAVALPRKSSPNPVALFARANEAGRVFAASWTALVRMPAPTQTEFRFPFGPGGFAVRVQRVALANCAMCGATFTHAVDLATHLALWHEAFCGARGWFDFALGAYAQLRVTVHKMPHGRRAVQALPWPAQYHCPHTMEPLAACDVFEGYAERLFAVDDAWYFERRAQVLDDEFADVSAGEKQVMKLWNAHACSIGPSVATRDFLRGSMAAFVAKHRVELAQRRDELLAFFAALAVAGKLNADAVADVLKEMDD